MSDNRSRAIRIMSISVVIAGLLAWAGSSGSISWLGLPVFALCIALAFVIQWVAFIPAYLKQTERFYDLVGSLTYLSLIACALMPVQNLGVRTTLIAAMVIIWAIRLGSFLFIRIIKDGSDSRFDAIKPDPLRFLAAWTLQGLWVAMTLSCALAAITSASQIPLGLLGIIGVALWLFGFTIEVIADYQKRVFKKQQQGKKGFISSGLWAYSRHPNYFGEIVLWIGVALVALPTLSQWQYVTLVSPIFVILLLTRISGVPMLEKSADERWGENEAYKRYKAQTPVLIPRLGKPEN